MLYRLYANKQDYIFSVLNEVYIFNAQDLYMFWATIGVNVNLLTLHFGLYTYANTLHVNYFLHGELQ